MKEDAPANESPSAAKGTAKAGSDSVDAGGRVSVAQLLKEKNEALLRADESQDQVQALLEALDLLSKLASMDHAAYACTLVSGNSVDGSLPDNDPDKDASVLQHRLDTLQSQWKLEDTDVPTLLQSIHRLQSHTTQLVSEADRQTLELHSLQSQMIQQNRRSQKLEHAVKKLHSKNRQLHEKLQTKKRQRKSIVKNVKDYVSQVNLLKQKTENLSVEEQRVAQQLKAHEQLLRLERFHRASLDDGGAVNRGRSATWDNGVDGSGGDDVGSGNRSRLSTYESFGSTLSSELDLAQLGLDDSTHFDENDEACSVASSISNTTSRSGSLIDEGVATVRYTGTSTATSSKTAPAVEDDGWGSSMRAAFGGGGKEKHSKTSEKPSPQVYKLTFPTGTKIGLQFQKVPLEEAKETTTHKRPSITESMLQQQEEVPTSEDENQTTPSKTKEHGLSSLSMNFGSFSSLTKTFGSLNKDDNDSHEELDHVDYAFVVCGYNGFDGNLNARPKLGARLVAVDDKDLEEQGSNKWTLHEVREALRARATANVDSSPSSKSTFTAGFRNDPLNKKQNEILNKAVRAVEAEHEPNANEATSQPSRLFTALLPQASECDNNNTTTPTTTNSKNVLSSADPSRRVDETVSKDSSGNENAGAETNEEKTKESGSREHIQHPDTPPGEKFRRSMEGFSKKFKLPSSPSPEVRNRTVSTESNGNENTGAETNEKTTETGSKEQSRHPDTPPGEKFRRSMEGFSKKFKLPVSSTPNPDGVDDESEKDKNLTSSKDSIGNENANVETKETTSGEQTGRDETQPAQKLRSSMKGFSKKLSEKWTF